MSIHSYEELAALHAIAKILAQPDDLHDRLENILKEMSIRLGMQRGMISLLDRERKEAWLDIAHDFNIDGMEVTYKPGEGITGKVAAMGRPMAVANLGQETHFLDRTGARRHLNRAELSFLCVPIMYDGEVIGVLSADKVAREVENLDKELAMLSSVAELMSKIVHIRALEEENRRLRKIVGSGHSPSMDIIGHSKAMQEVFGLVAQVADSNTTVLITGETGTGKELIARAIHNNSPRKDGPMVQVNCAAIPDTLIESELFGHEKGAFTGAVKPKKGFFEEADKGTIFLDEIGEIDQKIQAKLLRCIENRTFQRVGGTEDIEVDVRIIAATNKDLLHEVKNEKFREDLYYRLFGLPIEMPPLRERESDILILARHFISRFCKENNIPLKRMTEAAQKKLMSYSFPGNVRELKSVVELAVTLSDKDELEPADLMLDSPDPFPVTISNDLTLREYELKIIMATLQKYDNDIRKTAEKLDIGVSTIYRILQKGKGI